MTPILVGLMALSLAIVISDLRLMRLPNVLTLLLLWLFVAKIAVVGPGSWLVPQLVLAAVVFALGFAGFAARMMGGGDAKVLPALALFVPPAALSQVLFGFAAALVLSVIAILLARRVAADPDSRWAVLRSAKLPMGVPMGLVGLVASGVALAGV